LLHASGLVDLVIDTGEELVPVDFKDSIKASAHFKMQLAAYGIMLEEETGKPVDRGFVYLLPRRKAEEVRLTSRMK
jgi:CRISPR-associated exonuclease Cas4